MMVRFAREIGTPLNAHATIDWVVTNAGDDPDGRRFAKLREGSDASASIRSNTSTLLVPFCYRRCCS
jgi:hypothetical protein